MPETDVVKPITLDVIDMKAPALSTTSDMPVVETKPDASNEGKPPEPKDKAAPESESKDEGKTEGESATPPAETAASDEPPKKPAKGVQKALDRLTKQREEAEARAKAAEEERDRLLKAMQEGRTHPPAGDEAPVVDEDPAPEKPTKADFSDPEAWDAAVIKYADDKAAWTARREVKAAREADQKAQAERAQKEAQQAVQEAFTARIEVAKQKYEDFTEVAESPDVEISMVMAHAIVNSDQGPDIQYYLGKHPEEAKRIAMLRNVSDQLMELGVIAASLRGPAKAEASEPAPKPVTSAPAPIKPVSGGNASVEKSPNEMSMEEYAAFRKPQLQSERRPGGRR